MMVNLQYPKDCGMGAVGVGVRWYEEDGMGFPQTYGKPQWLVLPAKFTPFINKMYKEFKLNKRMNEFLESIK